MYDVVVIGAGVVGAMISRELAKYKLKICILDKENDVATGATRANSAIIHAGFDAMPGTLKATLNVSGAEMMEQTAHDLGVKYKKIGSLVIGFNDDDKNKIEELYNRGITNGVKNLRILDKEELRVIEPKISESAVCALYAPTGAIVCPYELTIAAVGNAMDNGADLKLNFEVSDITKTDSGFCIKSEKESVCAKYIINAAGLYADKISAMVGDCSFKIHPRKGEYILLDKQCGNIVKHTIFSTPTNAGKGILISPTVDGNLLTGPTSLNIDDKEDNKTTAFGLSKIMAEVGQNVTGVKFNQSITSFCGLRAVGDTGDFIINTNISGFINVAGIESPGLSASPAIARYVIDMLKNEGFVLLKKDNCIKTRKSMTYFKDASEEEKNEIIKKDKTFGRIVCRCEMVTEGEILEAIRTNPKATDLDGVKRRTRAQMGRCQGGFCSPYIIELISKENNIPYESVTKFGKNSLLNIGKTKEVR